MKKIVLPVFLSTVWISISEFFRNQVLLNHYWTKHYDSLGLVFPSTPINGVVWGIWSLCFAVLIYILSGKFTLIRTTFISWLAGFVLMWLVIGNMNFLPYAMLLFAIPLSFLEAFLASFIIFKLKK